MRLKIENLVPTSLTRRRGKQAYDALRAQDDGGPLEIELDGAELLSMSFLDELVHRLDEAGALERAVFVSTNPEYMTKLARVSHIRKLDVRCLVDGEARVLTPDPGPKVTIAPPGEKPPPGQY